MALEGNNAYWSDQFSLCQLTGQDQGLDMSNSGKERNGKEKEGGIRKEGGGQEKE